MSKPPPFEALDAPANQLGECPIWCERRQLLYWVDVLAGALWSHDPASGRCARLPARAGRLGAIAPRAAGGLILACEDGVHAYDPESGAQTFLVDPEPGVTGRRKNDGRADPHGHFWIGTLEEDTYAPVGRLYRIAPDLGVTIEAENVAIPNSLAFDAARQRMYFADTRAHVIWSCELDPATGATRGAFEPFARTRAPARPDGSCVDADGYLWNAEYAGGRLTRYAPSGEIERAIALPVSHPTCCCFGGASLDILFVTSARMPLDAARAAAEPLAGRVLALRPGPRGLPEFRARL